MYGYPRYGYAGCNGFGGCECIWIIFIIFILFFLFCGCGNGPRCV